MVPRSKPRPAPPAARAPAALHLVVGVLLTIGMVLRIMAFPVGARTPDEQVYTFYAQGLSHGGFGALPELMQGYVGRPQLHVLPPPIRLGHYGLVAGLMSVTGNASAEAGALLSTLSSCLILVLVAWLGFAYFGPWAALLALGFAVPSPVDLALARRAWGDELLALVTLAALVAFLEHGDGSRRTVWALACLFLAAYSVLVKETGILILAMATLGLTVAAWRASGPRAAVAMLGAGVIAGLLAIGTLVLAGGGASLVRSALSVASTAARSNPYVLRYQTGGIVYYARGLALLEPVPAVLGAASALLVAGLWLRGRIDVARPREQRALSALAALVLGLGTAAVLYPQKNLRFLSPLYASLDLLAAALIVRATRAAAPRLSPRVLRITASAGLLVLVLSGVVEHGRFVEYFVRRGIPDLVTPRLVEGR